MKNKGFTLIELLAVIIILGLLMLIAIPSVTAYINNSRKESYITSAKEIIKGATALVNSGELDIFDPSATYYIPSSCINLETGGKSPYGGDFDPAYILVTYDNNSYTYYWISRDEQSMGIKKVTMSNNLNTDLIEAGVKPSDVSPKYGIDGRSKIIVFSSDCSSQDAPIPVEEMIDGTTGEKMKTLEYPDGKTLDTVVSGDVFKIADEEFNYLRKDDNYIYLISKYNLNVGNFAVGSATNKQNERCRGWVDGENPQDPRCGVLYSNEIYWRYNVGEGKKYPGNYYGPNYPYVFDENSLIYPYVQSYKEYLEGIIHKTIEARLINAEDLFALGCTIGGNCPSNNKFIYSTSYWTGIPESDYSNAIKIVRTNNTIQVNGCNNHVGANNDLDTNGIRPVIIIPQ